MLYTPPTLTKTEETQAVRVSIKIHNLHDMKKRLYYITALVAENMRLLKQVNDLRDMLEIPPIQSHVADESRVG